MLEPSFTGDILHSMATRRRTPEETETEVLISSRRRCALCFGLFDDLEQKRGQIAHVDRDSSNAEYENLAFLCLPHHDEYDSRTSQSKRFTPAELSRYRDRLYERFSEPSPPHEGGAPDIAAAADSMRTAPRSLTAEQRKSIAQRLRDWPAYRDRMHFRCITVSASPISLDARSYAAQLRMAFEAGSVFSDDVWDFTWGSELDDRDEFREVNAAMLAAHHGNVTVWGTDVDEHEGEPLDQLIMAALSTAGVDVTYHQGPRSISGMVAVIVGSAGRELAD